MSAIILAQDRLRVKEDVAFILAVDRSGSMKKVEKATRDAVNKYIAELQSGAPITFSIATFASTTKWVVSETSVDFVEPLTLADYQASGPTALYDTIGASIKKMENMEVLPVHPVIVVFTDGEDSCSTNYDAAKLKPMIEARRKLGWRFIAFVVGQEAVAATEAAGFLPGDTAPYAGDDAATRAAFELLATSTKLLITAVVTHALPPASFLSAA
jgi:uncharacterized protein with von Willebrand factor type A (vWA) domain